MGTFEDRVMELQKKRLQCEATVTAPQLPFNWCHAETAHFDVYHAPQPGAFPAAEVEEVYDRLRKWSGTSASKRIQVYVYQTAEALEIDMGPSSVAFTAGGVIYTQWFTGRGERLRVLAHELAHVLFANHREVWLEEGLATWAETLELVWQARVGEELSVQLKRREAKLRRLTDYARRHRVSLSALKLRDSNDITAYTAGLAFILFVRSRQVTRACGT